MTPAEIATINRRALDNLQAVIDAVFPRGKPGSLPMALNPNTTQRVSHWHLLDAYSTGAWTDLNGGDIDDDDKRDIVGLVRHMAGGDVTRDEAARTLALFLDTLPPPAPPLMRPSVERHEVERPAPKTRSIADRRSLRRG
jgi:hypothetical protein